MLDRGGRNSDFGTNTSGGKWYFYNPATLSFGLSEFRKKWGKRKLEDDWRRANKKTINTFDGDSSTLDKINNQKNQDLKSEQYYLDQIPKTKKEISESNARIINAYYQSSVIYKEELEELRKSENMLENLVRRFPNHEELTPLSYYLMYNLQLENKNISKSKKTKQTLIDKFPEITIKSLLDSNYTQSVLDKKTKIELEYYNIYNYYLKDSFGLSYYYSTIKLQEPTTEENSKYQSKYFLINILSDFKLNRDTLCFYKKALEEGGLKYPNTNTSDRCGIYF